LETTLLKDRLIPTRINSRRRSFFKGYDVVGIMAIQLPLSLSYRHPTGNNPLSPLVSEILASEIRTQPSAYRHPRRLTIRNAYKLIARISTDFIRA